MLQVKYIELDNGELVMFSEAHQHGHMRNATGQEAISAGNVQAKRHRNGGFYGSSFSLRMDSNPALSWDRNELFAATYCRSKIFATSRAVLEEIGAENIRSAKITEHDGFMFPVGEGDSVEELYHFFVL